VFSPVVTDVSEEYIASIFGIEEEAKQDIARRRLQAGFCLFGLLLDPKMEAISSVETLVDSHRTGRRNYVLKDRTLAKYAATICTVFWGVMSFTLEKALHFRGTYRLHRQGRRVCEAGNQRSKLMEATCSVFLPAARRYNQETHILHSRRCERTSNPADILITNKYFCTVCYPGEELCPSLCERKLIVTLN
jgi:hypothetical protein